MNAYTSRFAGNKKPFASGYLQQPSIVVLRRELYPPREM